jgi:hypothetical protein
VQRGRFLFSGMARNKFRDDRSPPSASGLAWIRIGNRTTQALANRILPSKIVRRVESCSALSRFIDRAAVRFSTAQTVNQCHRETNLPIQRQHEFAGKRWFFLARCSTRRYKTCFNFAP